MEILLTGGSGMLGTAIQKELTLREIPFFAPSSDELNLLSASSTMSFIEEFQPSTIIHAAARVGGIQANIDDPYSFLSENIKMDSNLFDVAKRFRVMDLIYIGSTCMYPKDSVTSLSESDLLTGKLEPTNEGYALAKIVGVKTVEVVSNQYGYNWRSFVLSNLYGPKDHFEPEKSHLLAAIIRKIWEAKCNSFESVEMWGDGSSRREFTYVGDVSNFIADSLRKLQLLPHTLNLGTGIDYSVSEYYSIVSKLMNYHGTVVPNLSRPTGMRNKLSNISLASSFGWQPKTSLEVGLAETISWFEAQMEGK